MDDSNNRRAVSGSPLRLVSATDEALGYTSAAGVLRRQINAAKVSSGLSMADLTVLATQTEPYRKDTPAGHELARWFTSQVDRFLQPHQTVHLRGLHYRLISASMSGRVLKLDGTPYLNTADDWVWLVTKASKCARWLSYVPFDRIVDERNEPPRIYPDGEPSLLLQPRQADINGGYGIDIPAVDELLPGITFKGGSNARQRYRIVLIGEKTSLGDVLDPIASAKAAELLLPTGDTTDTMIYNMAKRASRDPRPLIVLYFSDFDPSGYHMPTIVARKLQALRDLLFPNLEVAGVYSVALTVEQCIDHELPESVLKETEQRAGAWRARWAREQTEIDALAALRPEVLRDITVAALRPFFDDTLERRQRAIEREYERALTDWLSLHRPDTLIDDLANARQAVVEANYLVATIQQRAAETLQDAMEGDVDELLVAADRLAEPLLPAAPEPIFTTDDDWVTATRKLIDRKRMVDDEGGAE